MKLKITEHCLFLIGHVIMRAYYLLMAMGLSCELFTACANVEQIERMALTPSQRALKLALLPHFTTPDLPGIIESYCDAPIFFAEHVYTEHEDAQEEIVGTPCMSPGGCFIASYGFNKETQRSSIRILNTIAHRTWKALALEDFIPQRMTWIPAGQTVAMTVRCEKKIDYLCPKTDLPLIIEFHARGEQIKSIQYMPHILCRNDYPERLAYTMWDRRSFTQHCALPLYGEKGSAILFVEHKNRGGKPTTASLDFTDDPDLKFIEPKPYAMIIYDEEPNPDGPQNDRIAFLANEHTIALYHHKKKQLSVLELDKKVLLEQEPTPFSIKKSLNQITAVDCSIPRVVFGTESGLVGVLDQTGKEAGYAQVFEEKTPVTRVAASPHIIVACARNIGKILYSSKGMYDYETVAAFEHKKADQPISTIALCPSGKKIAYAADNSLHILNAHNGQEIQQHQFTSPITMLDFNKQDELFVADRQHITVFPCQEA